MTEPHSTSVVGLGEGVARAECDCGWRSPPFGREKRLGTMDALQRARDAADIHEWESSLGDQ